MADRPAARAKNPSALLIPRGRRPGTRFDLPGPAFSDSMSLRQAIGLGAVLAGGFDDAEVRRALRLPQALEPTALPCMGAAA